MEGNKLVVAILGVGLIGGSMGLALKSKLKETVFIKGCSLKQEELSLALRLGAIDEGNVDPLQVVKDAHIIYLSTPVLQIVPLVKKIAPFLKEGTIITDAGSTKSTIAEGIFKILPPNIHYVPGHPMTGREQSGVAASKTDLFMHKAYVLVKDKRINTLALAEIKNLIQLIGGRIFEVSLAQHDRCASLISHIPHITASALVNLLGHNPEDFNSATKLAGGGFKDTTRIASSSTIMWRDICIANKHEIITHLEQLKNIINEMEQAIATEDVEYITNFFTNAKKYRDQIIEDTKQQYELI